jgi:hypothetical protein
MDLLLRRVPEVAFFPELTAALFDPNRLASASASTDARRIAELADAAFLESLRAALRLLGERAEREHNGGLRFLVASLEHFLMSLPPERHPLVVALYFRARMRGPAIAEGPELVARRMDDYDRELNV